MPAVFLKTIESETLKKICLYGPESTGKSTLAQALAERFGTTWSPEFARDHLIENGNRFELDLDVRPIVEGQMAVERVAAAEAASMGRDFLFCDTDVLTNANYCLFCFGKMPNWLAELVPSQLCDFYLFLETDLAWQADELRTHGSERGVQKKLWAEQLQKHGRPFALISGQKDERLHQAVEAVERFLA